MAKGKRKQTAKQRAASMKNLAKARAHALSKARRGGKKKLSKGQKRSATKRTQQLRHLGRGHAKAKMQKRRVSRPPAVPSHVRPSGRKPSRRKTGRKPAGRSQKQHAAAMRNLAKARRARKSAKSRHKVRPYKYGVRSKRVNVPKHMSWEARGKGKRKGKRGRKQTAAQRRASLRNLRKARAARRHGHASEKRMGRKMTPAKRRSLAAKRGARTRRMNAHWEAARRSNKRRARAGRGLQASESKGKAKKRQTAAQRRASLRNLKKARSARKSATKRHPVRGYSYHRKGGTRRVKGHFSWERVMENPLSGVGIFIGGFSGLVWFGVTDFVDRLVATHPLQSRGTLDASGHTLYADVPPTSGDYTGLFNATAITAPMNAWRWLAGVGMTGGPFLVSWVIGPEHIYWKDAFQGAGFGAMMRIGGKAIIDLLALLTMWTPLGEQLYDGEMRAQILNSNDLAPLASLPYAASPTTPGVAGAGKPCGQCAQCKNGVGACNEAGMGWPSMPNEASAQGGQAPAPPAPPPTITPGGGGGGTTSSPISGIAKAPALPEPFRSANPFLFGEVREREEEAA
jgi:hypothetical protein